MRVFSRAPVKPTLLTINAAILKNIHIHTLYVHEIHEKWILKLYEKLQRNWITGRWDIKFVTLFWDNPRKCDKSLKSVWSDPISSIPVVNLISCSTVS